MQLGNIYIYSTDDVRPIWVSREAVKFGFYSNNLERTLDFSAMKDSNSYSGFIGVAPPNALVLMIKLFFGKDEVLLTNNALPTPLITVPFVEPSENLKLPRRITNAEICHGQGVIAEGKLILSKARVFENLTRWPAPYLLRDDGFALVLPCNTSSYVDHAIFAGTAQNWFHFVVEVLTKIVSIENHLALPVIVPSNLAASQYDALRMITGIDPIISSNFHSIKANKLELCIDGIPRSITDISHLIPELVKIRKTLLDLVFQKTNTPNKIFIKRKPGLGRPMLNIDEIEAELLRYGIVGLYPDDLTFAEQVCLFSKAEIIVIESGAAMTNIMFCKEFSNILEINSGDGEVGFWGSYAEYFNLKHQAIEGIRQAGVSIGRSQLAYRLELSAVRNALDKIIDSYVQDN
jgi:capsular polysaccharide biosynthesis protein